MERVESFEERIAGQVRFTEVLKNARGPLPIARSFSTRGGTLQISISGSGWTQGTAQKIGMDIRINEQSVGRCELHANPSYTHLAFVPVVLVVRGLPAGNHALVLVADPEYTRTDSNDLYNVTIVEFPPA
jgi:hypothetical protein